MLLKKLNFCKLLSAYLILILISSVVECCIPLGNFFKPDIGSLYSGDPVSTLELTVICYLIMLVPFLAGILSGYTRVPTCKKLYLLGLLILIGALIPAFIEVFTDSFDFSQFPNAYYCHLFFHTVGLILGYVIGSVCFLVKNTTLYFFKRVNPLGRKDS